MAKLLDGSILKEIRNLFGTRVAVEKEDEISALWLCH